MDFENWFVPVLKNGPKLRTGTNLCPEEGKRGSAMALGIIVVGGKFASGNNRARAGRRSRA